MSRAKKLNLFALVPTDDVRAWNQYDQTGPLFERLVASERLLEQSTSTDLIRTWDRVQLTLVLEVSASLLLTFGLALFFDRSVRARLYSIRHNTLQIAGNEELLSPLAGGDEIAQLDLFVHETARQMKKLEAQKRSLTLSIAQRMNGPLEAIRSTLAHLMQSGSLNDLGVETLVAADRSVDRLIRMVGDLLHLDQLEDNRLQMNMRDVEVDDLINLSRQAVEQSARAGNVQIDAHLTNLTVWADRDRLVQATVNLLSNAIKFSPEFSSVSIKAEETNGVVRISIIDRGRGMPEEFQKRLFRRFSQAFDSDSSHKRGFGLGLAITKQIIDQHQGDISFTSKQGEGSTFTISLPKECPAENEKMVSALLAPTRSERPSDKDPLVSRPRSPLAWLRWLAIGMKLRQKGLLLVVVPLLFQVLFAVTLSALLWHSYEKVKAAAHARQVASQCTVILSRTDDMFLAAFSAAVSGQAETSTSYADSKKQLQSSLAQFMAVANTEELPAAKKIERTTKIISDKLEHLLHSGKVQVSDVISGARNEDLHSIDSMMDDVQDALTQLKGYEKTFEEKDPIARQSIRQQILWLLLLGLFANLSMALLLLYYVSTSISKRVIKIVVNVNRLLSRAPMLPPADGTDEIAEIDLTLHKTAERLFGLEQFKDELLSVVGHDLRTPLCSVQGYLLMVTQGMVGTLPATLIDEVTETEHEAERLVGFINDLLTAEKMKATACN